MRGGGTRSELQGDLFGAAVGARTKDQTPVELPLQLLQQTEAAWLLRPGPGLDAKWAPKELVAQLEGERAGVFRMPRWIADERGWR